MNSDYIESNTKKSLLIALLPIFFLIGLLSLNVYIFGDDALSGSNQIVLIFAAAVAAGLGWFTGSDWNHVQKGVVKSVGIAVPALIVLLLVGSLSGVWLLSGIIPAFVYYGVDLLSPQFFLPATCVICAIVSVASGSSWATAGTIGIALMSVGEALSVSPAMAAGAVISGSYFGDKLSPMSDTTNVASATAGTELFTHIRYMMYTTVPSIIISLILFFIIGLQINDVAHTANNVLEIKTAIINNFHITPWLFLVPAAVLVMIVRRVPAIPAMFVGVLLGGIFSLIFQMPLVHQISGEPGGAVSAYIGVMTSMYGDVNLNTGNAVVDELLSSSGMYGMLGTVWLIITAMIFGGIMDACGFLTRILQAVLSTVRSTVSLIFATVGSCAFFNLSTSDQYLSVVVPGRMFSDAYRKHGLAPENLSRSLEDSGTVTSVLVPWNTCGLFHASVLGVATLAYLPFCFFNIISPIMTMVYALFNIKIKRIEVSGDAS